MVQYSRNRLDDTFAALSDATRRGVLLQLGRGSASITELADRFHMSLTGINKHVGILERTGLVKTEKMGRVRTCKLGSCRLDSEAVWIARYKETWDRRFDALETVVQELKQKQENE
jgi:DNA-binding transcriptional ArsR family regulator